MKMKGIKWISLIFAILSAVSMMGIGMAIAEKSVIGVISCIVALIIIMGFGFKNKKKMRENGEL
jgi:hypothetical protein